MTRKGNVSMVEAYLRQSPLAHLHLGARAGSDAGNEHAGVTVSELPHRHQVTLRGSTADKAFMAGTEKVLKFKLPKDPCTSAGSVKGTHALWMGPDEWLIVSNIDVYKKLVTALEGIHAAVVDVSESRTTLRLSGHCARETLSKGCSIDLHPREFDAGKVVNTLLSQAHVTLHQVNKDSPKSGPAYDIFVHRSFAEYLWSWLEDATREYGLRVV